MTGCRSSRTRRRIGSTSLADLAEQLARRVAEVVARGDAVDRRERGVDAAVAQLGVPEGQADGRVREERVEERVGVGRSSRPPMAATGQPRAIDDDGGSDAAVAADLGDAHRVLRLAAAVGGAAGVEDLEAVALLVQRDVRVAEDDGVGVGEARAQAVEPAGRRAGVVDHRDPRAVRLDDARLGEPRRQRRLVDVAVHRADGRAERLELVETSAVAKSPAWRIRSAARSSATQRSGRRRAPRGRCVSEMMAIRTAATSARGASRRRSFSVSSAGRRWPSAPTSAESQLSIRVSAFQW